MLEVLALLASCSPPPPGFYDVRPPSGSQLPSNAQLVLIGYNFSNPFVRITQADSSIEIVPTVGFGIARAPIANLLGPIGVFASSTDPGAQSVSAEYEVIDREDTTPPEFAGIDSLSYEIVEDIPGFCLAGGFHVRAHISPAADDWQAAYYQLYEVRPDDSLLYVGTSFHDASPSLSIFGYAGTEESTRCYVVEAYDVAGNLTGGRDSKCIDLRYGETDAGTDADSGGFADGGGEDAQPRDAGTRDTGAGDGGSRDTGAGGGLTLDDRGGCGCSVMPTEHSSPLFVLLLLGLTLIRRKH